MSMDPVSKVSGLDLDCLPMLNISKPSGRYHYFDMNAKGKNIYALS